MIQGLEFKVQVLDGISQGVASAMVARQSGSAQA